MAWGTETPKLSECAYHCDAWLNEPSNLRGLENWLYDKTFGHLIIFAVNYKAKLICGNFKSMGNFAIQFEDNDESVQSLAPPSSLQRFEGIAFSSSGNILAVATSDTNTVFLFRRPVDGLFEATPYWKIDGRGS